MAVKIKAGGIAVIAVVALALGGVAFTKIGGAKDSTSQDSNTGAANASTLKPGEVAGTMTAVDGGTGASAKVRVATREDEMLPAPALAAEGWEQLNPESSAEMRVYQGVGIGKYPNIRRVSILKVPEQFWGLQIRQTTKGAIPAGSHLRLRVWARSNEGCPITVVCEHNAKPYEKLASREFTLTPQWQECEMEWIADRSLPSGWAQVSLQLGAKQGKIDLAGASLVASTPAH